MFSTAQHDCRQYRAAAGRHACVPDSVSLSSSACASVCSSASLRRRMPLARSYALSTSFFTCARRVPSTLETLHLRRASSASAAGRPGERPCLDGLSTQKGTAVRHRQTHFSNTIGRPSRTKIASRSLAVAHIETYSDLTAIERSDFQVKQGNATCWHTSCSTSARVSDDSERPPSS